jgi:hypothetical protein
MSVRDHTLIGSNDSASFQIERRSKIGNQRPFA